MTETWNFINTGSKDPYYNMAMDEALLNLSLEVKLIQLYVLHMESCNIINRLFPKATKRN